MKLLFISLSVFLLNPLIGANHKTFTMDSLSISKKVDVVTDSWFGKDKGMHVVGSFINTSLTKLSLKRFAGYSDSKSTNIALSVSFSLGIAKEIYDGQQKKNIFSYKDISANLLGSFLAYLVIK